MTRNSSPPRRSPECGCANATESGAIHTCPICCNAALRGFLDGGVDNRELFEQVDRRVSVSGLGEGEIPVEALGRWFQAEGLDPLV